MIAKEINKDLMTILVELKEIPGTWEVRRQVIELMVKVTRDIKRQELTAQEDR